MTPDPEKTHWGQENYGVPASQVEVAIGELLSTPDYSALRQDALACYFDRLIGSGLPHVMETELSAEDLKALSPDSVKAALILLIRDFLRRYRDRLVPPDMRGWQWIEMFTVRLLEATDTPVEPYVQWITHQQEGGEEDPRLLATSVAALLRMNPKTLLDFHLAMCQVVEEDILNVATPLAGEPVAQTPADEAKPKRSKPRYAKWQQGAGWGSALTRLFATLTGVVVAVAVVAGNEYVGSKYFPVPPTLDVHDTAAVNTYIASLPITALLLVLFGWFLGTFVGGCVALRIARGAGNRPAWMVSLALGVAALVDLTSFSHPLWFWIAALSLIPAAAWLAGLVCGRRHD